MYVILQRYYIGKHYTSFVVVHHTLCQVKR